MNLSQPIEFEPHLTTLESFFNVVSKSFQVFPPVCVGRQTRTHSTPLLVAKREKEFAFLKRIKNT